MRYEMAHAFCEKILFVEKRWINNPIPWVESGCEGSERPAKGNDAFYESSLEMDGDCESSTSSFAVSLIQRPSNVDRQSTSRA